MALNLGEKLTGKLDKAKEMMSEAGEQISQLKNAGSELLDTSIRDIMQGIPLIEEAGFEISNINIDLGLPPDIAISFAKRNEVSAEQIGQIMQAHEESKIMTMILKALQTAVTLQSKITMDKFLFRGVSIKLGIPPSVSLSFAPVANTSSDE